jgi:uncharacterized protein (DUF885 family)
MPLHMAEFGAPPYYSPSAQDGSQPGAYLFNTVQPRQAGSWALEAMAFHEGVPGHHMQFARMQLLPRPPLLQTAFYVVPHGEGWGLYAERLREDARSRLGAAFDIRDSHSAILDHGFLPLTVLGQVVAEWVASTAAT